MDPTRWMKTPARRWAILALALLAVVVLLPGLLRLETDNSPAVFFVEDSESYRGYSTFRRLFGSDTATRLVVRGEGLWQSEALSWLAKLELAASGLPGVETVVGIALRRGFDQPRPSDPETMRRVVLADPVDRGLGLVSADGATVTVVVVLSDGPGARDPQETLADLEALVELPPAGLSTEVVGMPVLNRSLDASSREIGERFFPLLVLFAAALLLFAFRDAVGVLMPLGFVGFCVLAVLGTLGRTGGRLNLVLAVLPPLLFVIALATALHLLLRFRDLYEARVERAPEEGAGPEIDRQACAETYQEKGWSVLWAGVTTLVGFASLALGPVAPVRALGLWAALGLALLTLFAFTLYPALLMTWGSHGNRAADALEAKAQALGRRWGRWANARRRRVLAVTGLFALLAILGLPRLQIESNALKFLAPDHPTRQAIETLEDEGIGLARLEVLLSAPNVESWETVEALERLHRLGEELAAVPGVLGVASAGSVLRSVSGGLPPSPIALVALGADPGGRRALDAFLADDAGTARLSLSVSLAGHRQYEEQKVAIEALVGETFPEAKSVLTGQYPLLLEGQGRLLATLGLSLGLTLLTVALILRCLLPGTRLTLLALLPNLAPVLGVLGFMGWVGIPLDVATVMVASVALGLAVDDTIHTLGHFRTLAPVHGAREGVVRTLEITAPAYLLTGLVLAAGFGVCALSSFAPTARFGLLATFAIVIAVLGDLFLLPALLSLTPTSTVERWGRRREEPSP